MPFLSDDLSKIPVNNSLLRKELGLIGKKVILYFGRITPQKGLMDLLGAFSKIQSELGNVVLLICGGADKYFLDFSQATSYEYKCRSLAEKLLQGKVIFVGQVNPTNKQDYFVLADFFVHPHTDMGELTDGWGLSLNEAASMSLPIITTDRVGSAPDLVVDGENGYIVSAGDIDQLSSRMKDLLCDDHKRRRFAASSRQVFEKYHQPSQITQNIWEAING
jgi:glycosyltransferase involved in cell wall biosynthesis